MYNLNTPEQAAFHVCGFYEVRTGNYFGGEPIRGTEVEVRVGMLKNGKDDVKGDMINGKREKRVGLDLKAMGYGL